LHKYKSAKLMTNVTMTATTSRQKILTYLHRQSAATATELARALRVTPADIRHHLSRLLADGLVEVGGLRRDGQRGRPHKIFRLSRPALGDSLPALASALMAEFFAAAPEEGRTAALRRLAGRISPAQPVPPGSHITRRLAATVEILNRMRYQAHWEAHAAGPRLILGQCPYAAIITDHPALCLMDKFFLEQHLSQPVEQLAKLEHNERGLPVCLFALR
jgi:predicted ArsR family transcriptional regulator